MDEQFYMNVALELASATRGQTAPNPVVGSVIVNNGQIVGMGAHLKAGEPHAEVHALRMAGEKAKGAAIYVTLEPCSHYGRTPPCAEAIIAAGIKRVIIASQDPNPHVSGKGLKMLKEAGIEVTVGVLAEKADRLNEVFFYNMSNHLPFVTMKQAITLDGKIATKTGDSKWITGEISRQDVHNDRRMHDAILVGANTILRDNPRLTNRSQASEKQPIRLILDTTLKIPRDSNVLTDGIAPTWIITGSEVADEKAAQYESDNIKVIKMISPKIRIENTLEMLFEKGVTSIYVEGGQQVNASFLKSGAVNRIITYISPKVIGGNEAANMIGDLQVMTMNEAFQLSFESIEQLGEDIKITSKLK
ncbi:riboflavin biosynthesis protein RibD [Bacillus sp. M6-12]|uniref:bifunctional diaminohydroxyphosphoribosylaminopyrimidine deaminase/5-amino-6-(5-phosphoribosylamino)uracil reductase RibD n=1 Tax=Bacillus sp. M6-12 TaxID=2054166 RepID=UPI000C76E31F|nr:bifunctional diaminohydroxyphosphoribosylaminopyrimidine deaminase/5-amino-6-(5-phosphoribosylamino)uracil reductase RibD [Bacillus sp. M6-12]PLS15986.1 riboflavin biosynthesis protein RibD [Bacillus sp. M6-12]